jgi:RsiW-degrading membrane proteinase PrsW (M82 family)
MLGFYTGIFLWSVIPPLLFLACYHYRLPNTPSLLRLLPFFIFGAISGFVALNLEWAFESLARLIINWHQIKRNFPGIVLRQLIEVGPIEEACKLAAVVFPSLYLQHKYKLRCSTIFTFTIAVASGFTAQENWVYLSHGTASIFERTIGTPVHAMFSVPWGYALGMLISSQMTTLRQERKGFWNANGWRRTAFYEWEKQYALQSLIPTEDGEKPSLLFPLAFSSYLHPQFPTSHSPHFLWAWLNSVICHALVNVLSGAWRFSSLRFLSYGLFPFILWMFWRLEQLLRQALGKRPIILISGRTSELRYWQRGLIIFALALGGNAMFGMFLLARTLSPLSYETLLHPDVMWFILSRGCLNILSGILALVIYRYLRRIARKNSGAVSFSV